MEGRNFRPFHGGLHCHGRGYGLALEDAGCMSAPVTRLTSVIESYGRLIAACAFRIDSSSGPGHETESLAVLQIDMRSMAESAELLGGRLERGELLEELLFRQHLRRESALALVVGVDEVLQVGFSSLNVAD